MFSRRSVFWAVAFVLVSLTGLGVAPAHAQEFIAYEGKNAVREGDGGAKKVVNGIDFWSDGAPPRRYQLLGFISDRRHKSGLIGKISMSNLEGDVASLARQQGGDAVILMQSEAETVGAVGVANAHAASNSAFGIGVTRGVQKQNSRFAVVKYLSDASVQVLPPTGAQAPLPAQSNVAPSSAGNVAAPASQ